MTISLLFGIASEIAFRVGTETSGLFKAREIPFSVAKPILRDVNEPGPQVDTSKSRSSKVKLE